MTDFQKLADKAQQAAQVLRELAELLTESDANPAGVEFILDQAREFSEWTVEGMEQVYHDRKAGR